MADMILVDGAALKALTQAAAPVTDLEDAALEACMNALIDAQPQWLPIDSAPKDGTRVQIAWANDRDCHARSAAWLVEYEPEGWVCSLGGIPVHPTHWMPLPASPGGDR